MLKNTLITFLTLYSGLSFGFRPAPESENVSSMIEGEEIQSIQKSKKLNLESGETAIDLWSGHYWPHFQGSLAVRYRDVKFQKLIDEKDQWTEFHELMEKFPYYLYYSKLDQLSPAEKYDLVVGDKEMSLTKYSWEVGEKASAIGRVPVWRGICDGWASASQKMPRPVKTVTLSTPEGQKINFFPEDIKALGSLLYARAQENVIFLGKRCRSRALGLFTNACDEINPGVFHRTLINRVGNMKKTFIADVSPGSEVWNYPVKKYEFTYFNVFSGEESKNFKEVQELFVKTSRFQASSKRHKRTSYIVGVKAKVYYADMRPAHTKEFDGIEFDKTLEKEYLYDLELDYNSNILGGESLSENLPDFIWAPNDLTYPLSIAEKEQDPSLPNNLAKLAKKSSKEGQPLSLIVEKLFESAKH